MILKKASNKAKKFACTKFHYSKSVPVNTFGYSVFNNKNEWCGVILYGLGANNNLAKSFDLPQGAVIELVRVALNGKQKITSKAIAISIKLVKKHIPNAKILVSYADENQKHLGIVYQATNWIYTGTIISQSAIDPQDGQTKHTRILFSKYGSTRGMKKVKDKPKHKYVYILNKIMKEKVNKMKKPYPKKLSIDGVKVTHNISNIEKAGQYRPQCSN